ERLVVEAHADQIAHARRRESCWWFIKRHDDPGKWVATHLCPGNQVVEKEDQQTSGQEKRVAIVPEEIFSLLRERGRRNVTLGPTQQYAEAFPGGEWARRGELERIGVARTSQFGFPRTLRPREARQRHLVRGDRGQQMHGGAGVVNAEIPAQP